MMEKRAIYFDTETTGLKPEKDHIIEIAAFDPTNDKTFHSLINPGIPIPEGATAIHKITDEMVKNAPDFSIVGQQFNEFCSGNVILIAHNSEQFDTPFLEHAYHRSSLEMPKWQHLDTLKWARKYRPDLPRHTLQYLRLIYGVAENNAHRALDDVVVLHQVFSLMIDDLTIDVAFELLSSTPKKQGHFMPFGKYQGLPLEEIPKSYVAWLAKTDAFEKKENFELGKKFKTLGLL